LGLATGQDLDERALTVACVLEERKNGEIVVVVTVFFTN
jgi:hypothetical protein